MNNRQRRLKTIELRLMLRQVVLLWLKDALQAGSFQELGQRDPPNRGAVANKVFRAVRDGMKGQPESLIEQAVLQARREADLLYLLIVKINATTS